MEPEGKGERIRRQFKKRSPSVLVYWTGGLRVFAEIGEQGMQVRDRRDRLTAYLCRVFFPHGLKSGQGIQFSVSSHKIGGFTMLVSASSVVEPAVCIPPELVLATRPTVWPLMQAGTPTYGGKKATHLYFFPTELQTDFTQFVGKESQHRRTTKAEAVEQAT